ncbi:hypothetical protein Tco_1179437 [Tanacetum coccineum]
MWSQPNPNAAPFRGGFRTTRNHGGATVMMMVMVMASGGVESRVRESDGGDRIDREMGRIFGVGRKSSPENFSGGCGGGRRLPDIWERRERDII